MSLSFSSVSGSTAQALLNLNPNFPKLSKMLPQQARKLLSPKSLKATHATLSGFSLTPLAGVTAGLMPQLPDVNSTTSLRLLFKSFNSPN